MFQELVSRMIVFHFLLQTGYTFENALRVIKRPLNQLPETVQANYELFMKLMADTFDENRSAIENIRAAEASYRKAKEEELAERQKQRILHGAPAPATTVEESESKIAEASRPSRPPPQRELPKYTE